MSKKLQAIILALGLSVMMFGVGCSSSDDNNDPPAGPTAQERLVGFWDATNPGDITGDNSSYVQFDFTADSTFSLVFAFVSGPLDDTTEVAYTGKYTATGNGQMSLTDVELDGEPTTDTYSWNYTEFADDDSMNVTHTGVVEGTVVGTYVNVTPVTAN
ncbi:MAG: hypothetical protein KDB65_07250 [Calditrichaeota bacterium]|nr:hypothetical protein [Calditrichota bacterium]